MVSANTMLREECAQLLADANIAEHKVSKRQEFDSPDDGSATIVVTLTKDGTDLLRQHLEGHKKQKSWQVHTAWGAMFFREKD